MKRIVFFFLCLFFLIPYISIAEGFAMEVREVNEKSLSDIKIKPGDEIPLSFEVKNTSNESIEVFLGVIDGTTDVLSHEFVKTHEPKGRALWVDGPVGEVTLGPNQSEVFEYVIRVPSDLTPGDYRLSFAFLNNSQIWLGSVKMDYNKELAVRELGPIHLEYVDDEVIGKYIELTSWNYGTATLNPLLSVEVIDHKDSVKETFTEQIEEFVEHSEINRRFYLSDGYKSGTYFIKASLSDNDVTSEQILEVSIESSESSDNSKLWYKISLILLVVFLVSALIALYIIIRF